MNSVSNLNNRFNNFFAPFETHIIVCQKTNSFCQERPVFCYLKEDLPILELKIVSAAGRETFQLVYESFGKYTKLSTIL